MIFNIFHDNEDGKVKKQVLKTQISVLNNAFSGKYSKQTMIDSNIRFRIKEYNYINSFIINKNKAEKKKLKYNCFLHKLDLDKISDIKNSPTYDKNRFEDGNCYSIKLLPKTTTVKSTINN